MKISRLKQTLAGFLSAAMLIMCMPLVGITASADVLAGTMVYILAQGGHFADGTTSKEVQLTDEGKLPAGSLSEKPTCDGRIFDGWYAYSESKSEFFLVDENYVFTDDNLDGGISVNVDARWYTACESVKVMGFGMLYNGYKAAAFSESEIAEDYSTQFFINGDYNAHPDLTALDWYCAAKGTTFDPTAATKCNNGVVDSDTYDYYLYMTLDLSDTRCRVQNKPTFTISNIDDPVTVNSYDATTIKISWKVPVYEIVTDVYDISITPDVTASDYVLEPGEAPTGFTGTAKAKTKSGKTFDLSNVMCMWYEEGKGIGYEDSDTIEEGKSYIPGFAFEFSPIENVMYLPASKDYLDVDEMEDLKIDADGYTYVAAVSLDIPGVFFTAPKVTSSNGSIVDTDITKPVTYLGDKVTLEAVADDKTGTTFELKNLPEITTEEAEAGFKYVYFIMQSSNPQNEADQLNEAYKNKTVIRKNSTLRNNSELAKNAEGKYIIKVDETSTVFLCKINTNYVTQSGYIVFAAKKFAAVVSNPVLDQPLTYLKDITLTQTPGDKTGASFTLSNVPQLTAQEVKEGYKYIYAVLPTGDADPEIEAEMYNGAFAQGYFKVGSRENSILFDKCNDLGKDLKVTVEENSIVYVAKVNPAYSYNSMGDDLYYVFAAKVFAVKPEIVPETAATKAAKAIGAALDDIKATNDTKESDVQTIVDKNKSDTTASVTKFVLTPATEDRSGELYVLITVTDSDNNTETVEKTYTIAKLPASSNNDAAPTYSNFVPVASASNTYSVFKGKMNVVAEKKGNSIVLSWDEINNADSYIVYQLKDGRYVKVATTEGTSVTFNNIKDNATYEYMVKYTVNGRRCSVGYAGKASTAVYNNKPVVTVKVTDNSARLSWEPVLNADKYAVYRYVDGKAVKLIETNKLSVAIKGLKSDKEYKYIVRAYVNGKWTEMKKSDVVTLKTEA